MTVILVPTTVTVDILCKGKLEDAQKVLKDAIDTIEKSVTAKDTFCEVSEFKINVAALQCNVNVTAQIAIC